MNGTLSLLLIRLQQEPMDFQMNIYELGELEPYLKEIGFANVVVSGIFVF